MPQTAILFHDDPLWAEPRLFSRAEAWMDLQIRAEESGAVDASVRELSRRWTWSKDKVARFLVWLVSEGRLTLAPGERRGRISVMNRELGAKVIAAAAKVQAKKKPASRERPVKTTPESDQEGSRTAQAREVWNAYVKTREAILDHLGISHGVVVLTDGRLNLLRDLVGKYGKEILLQAVEGVRYSDFHKGTGHFSNRPPRLNLENVFVVNGKINNVEVLSGLAARAESKAKKPATPKLVAPTHDFPDGHQFPDGLVWSVKLQTKVAPEDLPLLKVPA